jgi:Tol biopolymer transport system component
MADREEQLESLVTAALALPLMQQNAFLENACPDPELRAEAHSTLLALRTASLQEGSASAPRAPGQDRTGEQVSIYRIQRRLGSGGMGEVYLATDTRLGRQVALKFVPRSQLKDEQTMMRFEKEARTASALNHPNILTIYEVGQHAGERFIATEFIDGVTLRTELRRHAMALGDALDIAIQIASALVASHRAGIIHRDLKPGNIMLRSDGYLKVIDFGLAKLTTAASEQSSGNFPTGEGLTFPGSLLGTVAYMSPEQARGEEVDHRTDLWSLGVLLYEMIAGRRPFEGSTDSHVMVAIMERDAPVFEGAPPGLTKILERALKKDRGRRYQSAEEMLGDLREMRQGLDVSVSAIRVAEILDLHQKRRKIWPLVAGGAALLILLAVGWLFFVRPKLAPPETFEVGARQQLTYNGRVRQATISPAGDLVAMTVGQRDVNEAVMLRRLDGRVGEEALVLAPGPHSIEGITFSNDGASLWVVIKSSAGDMGKLYRAAVTPRGTAGAPEQILEDIDGPVSFSPDGREFAYVRFAAQETSYRYELAVADTARPTAPRVLTTKQGEESLGRRVAWSPDRKNIACIRYGPSATGPPEARILLVPTEPGHPERIVPISGWQSVETLAWLDAGRDLIAVLAAHAETFDQAQLRAVFTPTGAVQNITTDGTGYRGASLSADRSELVTVRVTDGARLWVSAPGNWSDGETVGGQTQPSGDLAWNSDGGIVFSSSRQGHRDLWVVRPGEQEPKRLTASPLADRSPEWVPGSDSVVFASNRAGPYSLWRFDIARGAFTQLTYGTYDDEPTISPDGKTVVYTAWPKGRPGIWRVPLDGGTPVVLNRMQSRAPRYSPDGSLLLCEARNDSPAAKWKACLLSSSDGQVVRTLDEVPVRSHAQWMPGGREISFIETQGGISNIFAYNLFRGTVRQLTHFREEQISNLEWSHDGKRLALIRGASTSDAFLYLRKGAHKGAH